MPPIPESSRTSGYRQRKRALEKARRRRRTARRLAGLGVLLLLVALVYGGVAGFGGSGGTDEPAAQAAEGAPGLVLVTLQQGDTGPVDVLLGSSTDPTLVLGLPANTLMEGPGGFDSLDELLASYPAEEIGLATLVGADATAGARVSWEEVRAVLPPRGGEGGTEDWPVELEATPQGAETAAQAFAALVQQVAAGSVDGKDLVGKGDGAAFADTLSALAPAPTVVGALPGSTTEGAGYTYYEPDLTALQRLLGKGDAAAGVAVEVQNGSGVVGIAERVTQALQPLGFESLPPKNAEQFPNVEKTRILAAGDVLGEADRVKEFLGQGQVVPREDLPSGRIVVVVGKDLAPESLP